jgi:hypothetical protein
VSQPPVPPDSIDHPFLEKAGNSWYDRETRGHGHGLLLAVQVFEGTWGEQEAMFKTRDVSEENAGVVSMAKELSALNHLADHKVIFEMATC